MAAIDGLGRELTILIVAHRLTTLGGCDQIVELCDGQVRRVSDGAALSAQEQTWPATQTAF
jgi:ATP-binding cassette subfamily B protein